MCIECLKEMKVELEKVPDLPPRILTDAELEQNRRDQLAWEYSRVGHPADVIAELVARQVENEKLEHAVTESKLKLLVEQQGRVAQAQPSQPPVSEFDLAVGRIENRLNRFLENLHAEIGLTQPFDAWLDTDFRIDENEIVQAIVQNPEIEDLTTEEILDQLGHKFSVTVDAAAQVGGWAHLATPPLERCRGCGECSDCESF